MKKAHGSAGAQTVRCAIYTRKSTEEGLDQDFNSLDAQREACEAYVASQRHEKWVLIPTAYDDGGWSGGNLERPALQRLLADIAARRIDVVVVYKVDRLTRSLIDFAKIVEALENAGASFVSITQAFNTTTSMGRLTLNVLLSFAQFEREVISERVRDKIAASKAKGIWMGGSVPLGYDVVDRKLIANDAEAEIVRDIYQRYLEAGSVRELLDALRQAGVRTKQQKMRDGSIRGGVIFSRGGLHHLLKNRIYVGDIVHKGRVYAGEHDGIVGADLFDRVQDKLKAGTPSATHARRNGVSLLTGMIRDANDRPLSPHHANKSGRRYRYYCSNSAVVGAGDDVWRLPAVPLEQAVLDALDDAIMRPDGLAGHIGSAGGAAMLADRGPRYVAALRAMMPSQQRRQLASLDLQMVVVEDHVDATCGLAALLAALGVEHDHEAGERVSLRIPVLLRRKGHETRIIVRSPLSNRDAQMIRHLRQAQIAMDQLAGPTQLSVAERRELVRAARLSYLAPDIVGRILDGRQPETLTARRLQRAGDLPLSWAEQRRLFGII